MIIPSERMILSMSRARRDARPSLRLPVPHPHAVRVRIGHGLIVVGRAIAGERRAPPASRPSAHTA